MRVKYVSTLALNLYKAENKRCFGNDDIRAGFNYGVLSFVLWRRHKMMLNNNMPIHENRCDAI